jgi:hypothetical protein
MRIKLPAHAARLAVLCTAMTAAHASAQNIDGPVGHDSSGAASPKNMRAASATFGLLIEPGCEKSCFRYM